MGYIGLGRSFGGGLFSNTASTASTASTATFAFGPAAQQVATISTLPLLFYPSVAGTVNDQAALVAAGNLLYELRSETNHRAYTGFQDALRAHSWCKRVAGDTAFCYSVTGCGYLPQPSQKHADCISECLKGSDQFECPPDPVTQQKYQMQLRQSDVLQIGTTWHLKVRTALANLNKQYGAATAVTMLNKVIDLVAEELGMTSGALRQGDIVANWKADMNAAGVSLVPNKGGSKPGLTQAEKDALVALLGGGKVVADQETANKQDEETKKAQAAEVAAEAAAEAAAKEAAAKQAAAKQAAADAAAKVAALEAALAKSRADSELAAAKAKAEAELAAKQAEAALAKANADAAKQYRDLIAPTAQPVTVQNMPWKRALPWVAAGAVGLGVVWLAMRKGKG